MEPAREANRQRNGHAAFRTFLEAPVKPDWEEAAPGIHVKILARNAENDSVSMLVRLDPGTNYPGHKHGGVEELHLFHGISKVDNRTLYLWILTLVRRKNSARPFELILRYAENDAIAAPAHLRG